MDRVLGIDPDTKNLGWAICTSKQIIAVGTVKAPDMMSMMVHSGLWLESILEKHFFGLAVVESQTLYPGIDPDDITKLSHVAGAAVGQIRLLKPQLRVAFPTPGDWKGQTPKAISHMRSYAHYGVMATKGETFAVPQGCAKITAVDGYAKMRKGDWKHVGCAIGLALYGARLLQSSPQG